MRITRTDKTIRNHLLALVEVSAFYNKSHVYL
jgi:hypothetical protein